MHMSHSMSQNPSQASKLKSHNKEIKDQILSPNGEKEETTPPELSQPLTIFTE